MNGDDIIFTYVKMRIPRMERVIEVNVNTTYKQDVSQFVNMNSYSEFSWNVVTKHESESSESNLSIRMT